MKLLTAIAITGIIIWYLDFMSPQKKSKRKIKFGALSREYNEKITRDKDNAFKKGESIGRTISRVFYK
jgi:hypothetical protein